MHAVTARLTLIRYADTGDVITWSGNIALIDDGVGNLWQRSAGVVVKGHTVYLPVAMKGK